MRLLSDYLEPADRLVEVVCGLVMVLTFTLTAGLTVADGAEGVRTLLTAAVGCNVAWGIIDGVTHVMARLVARGRQARLVHAIRGQVSPEAARVIIARELDGALGPLAGEPERARFYEGIRALAATVEPRPARVERRDLLGAVEIFAIDVLCTLPAIVPFLLLDEPHVALRWSNALLMLALFAAGYVWAGLAGRPRVTSGLALALVGGVLVALAIVLGG